MKMATPLNDMQIAVLRDYDLGAFDFLAEAEEIPTDFKFNDLLLQFILHQLSDEKLDTQTAKLKLSVARDELSVCIMALGRLGQAITEKLEEHLEELNYENQ